jgi:hypothetical protein
MAASINRMEGSMMDRVVNAGGAGDAGTGEGPREAVIARRLAAYAVFVVGGWAVAGAACGLVLGWGELLQAVSRPQGDGFWVLVLPGLAAALGAAAVHWPFMRAVREGRVAHAHGWAAAGVLAAHAAYVVLGFVAALGAERHVRDLLVQHQFGAALASAWEEAWIVGLVALIFGFLPNVLVAEVFAGVMVHRHRPSRSGRDVHTLTEGAGDESAAFAE